MSNKWLIIFSMEMFQFQRTIVEAREYCNVTISEGGRQPNTQCVWPFRYKKKLYDGVCTNVGVSNCVK